MPMQDASPAAPAVALRVALLAVIYFVAARLSLTFAIPPGFATALWPPSGIALAAVLLYGNRVWPGIWLGAALVNLTAGATVLTAVGIGTGNTLEALIGALLTRRYIGDAGRFECGGDVIRFVALAAVSAAFAASVGLLATQLNGNLTVSQLLVNWWTWWQGDTTGILLLTPLILNWMTRADSLPPAASKAEAAAVCVLLPGVTWLVFSQSNLNQPAWPITFAIIALIIWIALRFRQREVTIAVALVCAIAVKYTVEGCGPFVRTSHNESLLLLLAFISTVAITGLVLSAVLAERHAAYTRLTEVLELLQAQAITDALTGLYNRRFLGDFLPREWARAERKDGSLAIIMIDLDRFKQANDTYGHATGDLLLTEIGNLLKSHIRGSDIACRYGGEEFTLVLPDSTPEGALRRAEEIRSVIKRLSFDVNGATLQITASLGIALYPQHAQSADELLHAADCALYAAKRNGRDRVEIASAANRETGPLPGGAWQAKTLLD